MRSKVLLLFTFLFLIAGNRAYAQTPTPTATPEPEFDFDRAYQDYVFTMDIYNNAHSEYLLAKAQYQQSGTLVSQTKAQEATVKMLEARDDVVVTYITAVRMRLVEAEGVSALTKNGLFARIDAEVAWFQDHKSRIQSAGTLQDLSEDSEEAAERFFLTERTAYEALSTVPFGKLSLMRSATNAILTKINSKVFEIRANQDKDTAIIERWAFETENKITRSLDKEIEAQALIPNFSADSRNRDHRKTYNDIIFRLDESRQFLRDATGFIKEILHEITTI